MLARPAVAALSCRQCSSAILRAITSTSAPGFRTLPRQPIRRIPTHTSRLFSSGKSTETVIEKNAEELAADLEREQQQDPELSVDASTPGDVPWFLEVEPPRHIQSQHTVTLPKIPEDAPAMLEPMIKYVYEDMGLDDISLLDLRDLDTPAALGPNLIMLFGTARSERHLHISSGRFQKWLKRNHRIHARADGLIGPGELRTKLRRLRKKAKLLGTNTAIIPGGDNGISTGWVCVNFSYTGEESNEAVSFDESGRFSGFGASQNGTTVVVQCMTESRRQELNLETLWQGILKRSLERNTKIRGEQADQASIESLLASKIQLPTSPSALQWQALTKASQQQQQQRHFSTSTRRFGETLSQSQDGFRPTMEQMLQDLRKPVDDVHKDTPILKFDLVRTHIEEIQLFGVPLTYENTFDLIRGALLAESEREVPVSERLALVDQVYSTVQERGMDTQQTETIISIIEIILSSPAYGPELQRAQENFEYILAQELRLPSSNQIARLMLAYAERQQWDKFWDAFRLQPRFNQGRDPKLYELALRCITASRNKALCIAALRHVWPEMRNDEPEIELTVDLYQAVLNCLLTIDLKTIRYFHNPPVVKKTERAARIDTHEGKRIFAELEAWRDATGLSWNACGADISNSIRLSRHRTRT